MPTVVGPTDGEQIELFDPAFDQVVELDAQDATQRVRIQTSEPIVLTSSATSAVPDGYRRVPVPAAGDLYVNGDVVRIQGRLLLPGRAVQINARVLELAADDKGRGPTIDVSGAGPADPEPAAPKPPRAKDGHNAVHTYHFLANDDYTAPQNGTSGQPGKDGNAGRKGKDAGWIVLHCDEMTTDTPAIQLDVCAAGGAGGTGQAGQGGQDGGNGGKGSDAWKGGVSDLWEATRGANAGAGGTGGRGGPGGPSGKGGTVRVFTRAPLPASVDVRKNVSAGRAGTTGEHGQRGADGVPGTGGRSYTYSSGGGIGGPVTVRTLPAASSGGIATAIPQGPSRAVQSPDPEEGTAIVQGGCEYHDLSPSAQPAHLEMLLAQIRHDGLGLDATNHASVRALKARITWLLGVSVAYSAQNPKARDAAAVRLAAAGISDTFRNPRLDWFGHTPGWAPTVSLKQYDDLLTVSLDHFSAAEDAWARYRAARNQAMETTAQKTSAIAATQSQLKGLRNAQEDTRGRLSALAADISLRAKQVDAAKDAVIAAEEKFKANVQRKVSLSFTKYLDVIEQAAFAMSDPPAAMTIAATEEIKFWKGAFEDLPGDDGQSIPKDYMIHKLDVFGDAVSSLDEAFKVVDGYLQLGDKDGYKLICTQRSLDDLLDNFHTVEGADDAKEAMAAYVKEVTTRNNQVLAYNTTRAALVQQIADAARLTAHKDTLEADAIKAAPAAVDRGIQAIYDRAKQTSIDDLYRANRASRFWLLKEHDVFGDVLGCKGPADVTHLQLQAGRNEVLHNRIEDLEKSIGDLQERRDPIVVTFDVNRRIRSELRKDRGTDEAGNERAHHWEFDLDPPMDDSRIDDSPFEGWTNVRLVEVRCWLVCLESPFAIKVHLTQMGDEQIVSPNGEVLAVEHDPVEKVFEYVASQPSENKIETRACYWAPTVPGELPTHTPIGPFATWRIGLRPQDLAQDVDWNMLTDRLTQIRLEFTVRSQGPSTV